MHNNVKRLDGKDEWKKESREGIDILASNLKNPNYRERKNVARRHKQKMIYLNVLKSVVLKETGHPQ